MTTLTAFDQRRLADVRGAALEVFEPRESDATAADMLAPWKGILLSVLLSSVPWIMMGSVASWLWH
jgi:hypothetical protein